MFYLLLITISQQDSRKLLLQNLHLELDSNLSLLAQHLHYVKSLTLFPRTWIG